MTNQKTQNPSQKMQARTAELHVMEAACFAAFCVSRETGADPYAKVARRIGPDVARSRIWSLVHRPRTLKGVASHIREGLAALYAAECERQKRLLDHEIAIARALGAFPALVGAAADLAGVPDGAQEAGAP